MRMMDGMELTQDLLTQGHKVALEPLVDTTDNYIGVIVIIPDIAHLNKEMMKRALDMADKYGCQQLAYKDKVMVFK